MLTNEDVNNGWDRDQGTGEHSILKGGGGGWP